MKKLNFLNKLITKRKLELVEPSKEISQSYSLKSDNCLKSAKILHQEKLYENSITESYYAMYNSLLSLLFRCGIKSENHTASILLLKNLFNFNKLKNTIQNSKKERIDKQYYVTEEESKNSNREASTQLIKDAEEFILDMKTYLKKLGNLEIEEIRKKFNKL